MEYKSMIIWNPWHGCKKYSSGCLNCYVYRRDQSIGKDSSIISKTNSFDLPLKRNRSGEYKITASDNPVYICMTSDFFIEYADQWRKESIPSILQRNIEKQNSRGSSKSHGSYSNALYRLVQTNSDLPAIIRQRIRPWQQAVQLLICRFISELRQLCKKI